MDDATQAIGLVVFGLVGGGWVGFVIGVLHVTRNREGH